MTETTNTAEVPPRLLDFHQERIRVLHFTWIAFFMTFYVWFNLAPLSSTMRENSDWLTKEHVKVLLIANVALTIPARIVVGALIDRFGARVVFTWLMITHVDPGDRVRLLEHVHPDADLAARAQQRRCRLRDRYQDGRPVVPAQVHRAHRRASTPGGATSVRPGRR